MSSTGRGRERAPRVLGPWRGKWLLNLFPPLFANRIRVVRFADDFRTARVEVRKSLFTRNLNGTTFGGTIFSAADPMYAVMYWQVFAREGVRLKVWLKSARIDYLAPAASTLTLDFAIGDDELAHVRERLAADGRHVQPHRTEAIDRSGKVCAVIETDVYMRASDPERSSSPAI